MKKLLISLAMVLVLAGTMAVPAMAEVGGVTAEVTVNEIIDSTNTEANANDIQFGKLHQRQTDQPDCDQSTTDMNVPAATVDINSTTNVRCDVKLKGTDFHNAIPITGASWAEGAHDATKAYMTTSYQLVATGVARNTDVDLWLFLSIPSDAAGGTHSSTYTYEVVATP